ncbi:unnamed protein product [Caenorhabditis angaria]|uniref:Uncharacterized protein n=1 Tax=Caenorhabditis angaria TaxID=860376 RepID=A0A9P1N2H8_9PELO|nr:unnamed protein product [Caenorhabditis angaria]
MENDYSATNYEEYPEDDYCPSKMLRGPGQKAANPFQFVATNKNIGEEMADAAKYTLHLAEQQKVQREKILKQQPKFDDTEPWQADLDTWRRKRKEKIVDTNENNISENSKSYSPYRKAKDEILHINSQPQHSNSTTITTSTNSTNNTTSSSDDLNNDSGIDNRTVGSPSTSEFSPRSTDLFISPKSVDEEPPHHPPPPPPTSSELDQVLIPLKYSKQSYYDQPLKTNNYSTEPSSFNSSPPVKMPINSAKVEATFKQPPSREGVKPFVSRAAQELFHNQKESENIDLTVELNREQKATVTATKYPRSNDFIKDRDREPSQEPPIQKTTTRIYHAVDIPFDESPASYHPIQIQKKTTIKNGGVQTFNMNILMGSQPVHKGFGFSVAKKDDRFIVESVIVASPADKAGLLVGDTIISINGEDMIDKYQSRITQILHDAARIGEADILISRAPVVLSKQNSSSSINFDKARSIFNTTTNTNDNRSFDSYTEFKRKHSRASRDSTSTSSSRSSRDFNSLPRGNTNRNIENGGEIDRRRDTSLSSYRTARENFNSLSTTRSSGRSDYGDYRVTSAFEEKNSPGRLTDFVPEVDRRKNRNDDSEDIYHKLRGDQTPKTIRNFHVSNENVAKTNITYSGRRESEEESTTTTLKRSTLPRSGSATHWRNEYSNEDLEQQTIPVRQPSPLRSALKKHQHNYPPIPHPQRNNQQRKYYSTESLHRRTKQQREIEYCSSEEEEEAEMRTSRTFHTVGSYGTKNGGDVSDVSHRFYDRDGKSIRAPRERSIDIEVRREYLAKSSQLEESRDWRDVINQQRQPAPGYQLDRRGISAASASLSNLPTFINRRIDRERERERGGSGEISEKYERDEYRREEQRNYAPIAQQRVNKTSYEEKITEERKEENVVAVSGKHRCSHCSEELGRGAAMIVESLNLFYHLACFKCYVCKTSLGSGSTGADVRVRDGRLHCQTCYSNHRVQLSKV